MRGVEFIGMVELAVGDDNSARGGERFVGRVGLCQYVLYVYLFYFSY
jgi:hypothetical protein